MDDVLLKSAFEEAKVLLKEYAIQVLTKRLQQIAAISGHTAGSPSQSSLDQIFNHHHKIFEAVEVLSKARVGRAHLVLSDTQPIPRVSVTFFRGKTVKMDPHNLLKDTLNTLNPLRFDPSPLTGSIVAMWPALSLVLAGVQADAMNAVQKALEDERITGPIKARIDKKRALAKQRAARILKHHFKGFKEIFTEDEITALWREVMIEEVMES